MLLRRLESKSTWMRWKFKGGFHWAEQHAPASIPTTLHVANADIFAVLGLCVCTNVNLCVTPKGIKLQEHLGREGAGRA